MKENMNIAPQDEGDLTTLNMIRRLYSTRKHPELQRLDKLDNLKLKALGGAANHHFVKAPEPLIFESGQNDELVTDN